MINIHTSQEIFSLVFFDTILKHKTSSIWKKRLRIRSTQFSSSRNLFCRN